jgi:3-hydroxyacyl-[acyl-carrier-protein] dehydratase
MLEGVLYELLERTEDSARVRLLPESPIYKAHFPGYPVTPGVTIVQMALECMGCKLSGAKDIKFVVPVLPSAEGTEICFRWVFPEPGKADISVFLADETLCAKLSISV